jgi:Xaa-Pro aminopeptidase
MNVPAPAAATPAAPPVVRSSAGTFAERRRRLGERIGDRSAALIFAAPEATRNADSQFDYRQNSDLYYLTGFEEPECAALIRPGHEKHPFVLFVRKRNREREVWDGARAGVEGAKADFGADEAFAIDELDAKLPEMLEGCDRLFYALGLYPDRDVQVVRALGRARMQAKKGKRVPREVVDPAGALHEQRLVKSPAEIEALRRAARVSAEAHVRAMKATRPGVTEFEIQAEVEYVFKRRGARAPGYTTIVGSGPNACVLHYVTNRRTLGAGELLLLDAGAEVDYYTGDVTRTWPVSGKFSGPQREIYDLVLRAQREVIRLVKPGLPWTAMHEKAVQVLAEGLVDRGLIEGPVEKAIEEKRFRPYYMHSTGHWLGMDVHDVGGYYADSDKGRPLEPGMVFTVEPGLYFAPDAEAVPERYRGIGVRIEDDLLVTDAGAEILSQDAPVDPDEIESIVGTA